MRADANARAITYAYAAASDADANLRKMRSQVKGARSVMVLRAVGKEVVSPGLLVVVLTACSMFHLLLLLYVVLGLL